MIAKQRKCDQVLLQQLEVCESYLSLCVLFNNVVILCVFMCMITALQQDKEYRV